MALTFTSERTLGHILTIVLGSPDAFVIEYVIRDGCHYWTIPAAEFQRVSCKIIAQCIWFKAMNQPEIDARQCLSLRRPSPSTSFSALRIDGEKTRYESTVGEVECDEKEHAPVSSRKGCTVANTSSSRNRYLR